MEILDQLVQFSLEEAEAAVEVIILALVLYNLLILALVGLVVEEQVQEIIHLLQLLELLILAVEVEVETMVQT